jgi:hypothetical protein
MEFAQLAILAAAAGAGDREAQAAVWKSTSVLGAPKILH